MIYIENKKRKLERIQAEYPTAQILDITSIAPRHSGQILSPFYPHDNIPIPFTDGLKATCVEAVWQGLKVFAAGIIAAHKSFLLFLLSSDAGHKAGAPFTTIVWDRRQQL